MAATEPAPISTASLTAMEAASRWETEAIRESRDRRRARPTVSQQRATPAPDGDWRTLREASDETGIPIGTLRKWCRRETVESYLESDGEQTLRMLEMGSVERNAKALGRDVVKSQQPEESYQPPAASHQPEEAAASDAVPTTDYRLPTTADEVGSTMIVPVDAWNKMLTQLGNLHEAGQQLAEARERAGKAETEVKFLRERLGEIRESYERPAASYQQEGSQQQTADSRQPEGSGQPEASYQPPAANHQPEPGPETVPPADASSTSPSVSASSFSGSSSSPSGGGAERSEAEGVKEIQSEPSDPPPGLTAGLPPEGGEERVETTSFWRYVVRGWRGRKR